MSTTHATRITDDLVLPHLASEALDQPGGAVNGGLTILHHPALAVADTERPGRSKR